MPKLRSIVLVTLSLVAVAPGGTSAGAAVPTQPPPEVAEFRQGERDFANRHDDVFPCDFVPTYGTGECHTRRRT